MHSDVFLDCQRLTTRSNRLIYRRIEEALRFAMIPS